MAESLVHSLPPIAPPPPHPHPPSVVVGPYAPYAQQPGPYTPAPYHHPIPPPPHHDSTVYRNPYEEPGHRELVDAIRTQDKDLAVSDTKQKTCDTIQTTLRVTRHEYYAYACVTYLHNNACGYIIRKEQVNSFTV